MLNEANIREFIFENFLIGKNEQDLDNDDSFLEKGNSESTGVLELIMLVEEIYGMEVADDEVIPDNFDSVSKLCIYIVRKTS